MEIYLPVSSTKILQRHLSLTLLHQEVLKPVIGWLVSMIMVGVKVYSAGHYSTRVVVHTYNIKGQTPNDACMTCANIRDFCGNLRRLNRTAAESSLSTACHVISKTETDRCVPSKCPNLNDLSQVYKVKQVPAILSDPSHRSVQGVQAASSGQ